MSQVRSYCLYPVFRLFSLVILFALIMIFGAVCGDAQDASTGAVRGNVSDTASARIDGAIVALVNASTGLQYSATSNQEGEYVFQLLPPGDYTARAEFSGMSPQLSPLLHVEVGGTSVLNFQLPIAGAKESITVSGAPPLIETQPSAVSAVIEEKAIESLPLNGRRFTDLALLAPGVTQDPRGLTSSSNGDLAFGGVRGYQSSYLVDGADNNNGFFSQ
ncbi:MAG: carboxypeptidase regulatory-like domain-containing protein, partial [Acidobacteriota bacterium]